MTETPPAFTRRVFYVGGFYLGGPAFYRGVLAREAARHGRVRGATVALSGETTDDLAPCWTLAAERPEGCVRVRYALLRWEDIVLQRLARPWTWRLAAAAATLADYLATGAAFRMLRLSRRFGLMWLYPFAFYAGALVAAALAGWSLDSGLRSLGWDGAAFASGLAGAGGVLLAAGALGWRSYAYLFLNNWIFSREIALDRAPDLWERLDAFAARVAQGAGDADETVVVGHSFGASLAPLVAVRAADRAGEGARITVLTLGASPAVIGLHPKARRFREEVGRAASHPGLAWIDLSSSYDALNFKRFDPVAGLGLDAPGARAPLLLDIRFDAGRGRLRKLGLMRLHMRFIKASESAEAYDYIDLVTGAAPIAERLSLTSARPPAP